jgi:hypothetical protein
MTVFNTLKHLERWATRYMRLLEAMEAFLIAIWAERSRHERQVSAAWTCSAKADSLQFNLIRLETSSP